MCTFWPDSGFDQAKNSLGTALNKLRKLLSKLGEINLVNEKHSYRINTNSSLCCDYLRFQHLKSISKDQSRFNSDSFDELLKIVRSGKFLPEMDYEWLEPFRATVTNGVAEICLDQTKKLTVNDHANLLLRIGDTVLSWDFLNQEALRIKIAAFMHLGRYGAAKRAFEEFELKYEETYEEPFNLALSDLISSKKS
ncbi:MAG: hypothetical protein ACE5HI_11880 [bacterium]